MLLRAWPEIRSRTGLRLTVAGADPLAVRLLLARLRVPDEGIDVVGFLSQEELTATLLRAKALIAPSIGQESFGMVLTRAFACSLPVVASDIPGYREVVTPEAARRSAAERHGRARRRRLRPRRRRARSGSGWAAAARSLAVERYSWPTIASRLERIYEAVTGLDAPQERAA